MKIWGWEKKPRTMQRYLKRGDIFCFVYDDTRYCFGRIIEINPKRFCIVEIFDHISETPDIDEETISKAVRILPPINVHAYVLFDQKLMGGDWRIIGHQEDYLAPDYDEIFIGWGVKDDWKKEDLHGNMTKVSEEEYKQCLSHIAATDLTVKELLKDSFGERKEKKTADDIRKAIQMVKYGLDEYLQAVNEVPDFDVNDLDKYKRNLLQEAILDQKWDVAEDLIKRGIDVNNQDDKKRTALHYLCASPKSPGLAETILKAGGDPNIRDKENKSPLYEITANQRNDMKEEKYQIMEMLLKFGADKTLPCRETRTAVDVAETIGEKKTIEILAKYAPRPQGKNAAMEADELYQKVNQFFGKREFFEVVDALYGYPKEKMTRKMTGLLIASYNNLEEFDKALKSLEEYRYLYKDIMRIWYYFATFAYVGKKDCDQAMDCIEAGIAECDREKEAGTLVGEDYNNEIRDFDYLKSRCQSILDKLERERKASEHDRNPLDVKSKEYKTVMIGIRKMILDENISDEEIRKKISENPETIPLKVAGIWDNYFVNAVLYDRMELAKWLAENGADIHLKVEPSLYNGNALNAAHTPEMADWLLSLGIKVEKNLEQNIRVRKTPYDNPAVVNAGHNDPVMMRYWLSKEKVLFADEPEYIESLFRTTISMASCMNSQNMLTLILGDDELYPYLKREFENIGDSWKPLESIKLAKRGLKTVEDETLADRKKELTKILNQKAKEIKEGTNE